MRNYLSQMFAFLIWFMDVILCEHVTLFTILFSVIRKTIWKFLCWFYNSIDNVITSLFLFPITEASCFQKHEASLNPFDWKDTPMIKDHTHRSINKFILKLLVKLKSNCNIWNPTTVVRLSSCSNTFWKRDFYSIHSQKTSNKKRTLKAFWFN